jgi:hypothetical protein
VICQAHTFHRPVPTYRESHHAVPQAWQRHVNDGKLFDPRIIRLCRTGHGNVHYWLAIMNRTQAAHGIANDILPTKVLLAGHKYNRKESEIARIALLRWLEVGYDLKVLWDNHMWGGIGGSSEAGA